MFPSKLGSSEFLAMPFPSSPNCPFPLHMTLRLLQLMKTFIKTRVELGISKLHTEDSSCGSSFGHPANIFECLLCTRQYAK